MSSIRVMFLDIDGVANSAEFLSNRRTQKEGLEYASDEWWATMVDPAAVERLNVIVESAGNIVVVISSSWRYHVAPDKMQRVLASKGFRGSVIGRTPLMEEMPESHQKEGRSFEIKEWLGKNRHLGIESFVILDDDIDASLDDMAAHFVQTTWKHGLLDEHVLTAIELLT